MGNEILSQEQKQDKIIGQVINWKIDNRRPNWSEISGQGAAVKAYWSMWKQLEIKNDVLYKRWDKDIKGKCTWQLVVPEPRRQEILEMVHDHITAGHLGEHKTLANLRLRFYWYGHRRDVERWCGSCEVCATHKGPGKKKRAKLGHVTSGMPMEKIALDIMGPLPRSNRGNKYLLVLSDYFTKWVEAYPMPNQEALTVARKVVEEFVCRFGVPISIHTDQGRQFESALFQELCELLDIEKSRTTPFHPQCDGLVERMNRTLENMMSVFISEHQRDWDEIIPFLLLAYRSTIQESTNASPNLLMLGREVFLPVDVIFGKPPQEYPDTSEYVTQLQERLQSAHEYVRVKIQRASSRQKRYYDRRANGRPYNNGDLVWLYEPNRKPGMCKKLQRYWKGPFTILQKINDLLYRIQRSPKTKSRVVHFDRLKEYRKRGDLEENNQITQDIACDVGEENPTAQEKITDTSSDEEYLKEQAQCSLGIEDGLRGLSMGEGALQGTQGQINKIPTTRSGQTTPCEELKIGQGSPGTSEEETNSESEHDGDESDNSGTINDIVSDRGKDFQGGLGDDPLEISGPDTNEYTSDNPRRSKRTRREPDQLMYN